MRVLERLPAAEKAQMLSPSVLCCRGTSAELAPAAGGKQPRLVDRQTLRGALLQHGRVSTLLLLPVPVPGLQCALGPWMWHFSSGDSQHSFSWRLCTLDPSECLPIHFPLRLRMAMSDWLLSTGYWGNTINGTCQHALESLSWAWHLLP